MKTITEFNKEGVQTEYYEKSEVDKQIKELKDLLKLSITGQDQQWLPEGLPEDFDERVKQVLKI